MWVFLIFLSTSVSAQVYNSEVEAEIQLNRNTEFLEVTGFAYNRTRISQSLEYVLTIFRTDENGNRSKKEQSNRFILQPGEKIVLSSATIDAFDPSKMIILLLIYNIDKELLGKDRIVLNDDSEDERIVLAPNEDSDVRTEFAASDGVELRGIVLEDTKTKPGRDFYREYISAYQRLQINGPKVVTVKEVLAIANNTKIEVIIDNEVIMEFFVRPQNDYISGMAEAAIGRSIAYFEYLEKQKNIVRRY